MAFAGILPEPAERPDKTTSFVAVSTVAPSDGTVSVTAASTSASSSEESSGAGSGGMHSVLHKRRRESVDLPPVSTSDPEARVYPLQLLQEGVTHEASALAGRTEVGTVEEEVAKLVSRMLEVLAEANARHASSVGATKSWLLYGSPALVASQVPVDVFNSLLDCETRPKVSLQYEAASGGVSIYELPKDGHDDTSRTISNLFRDYERGQAGRRVPPAWKDFMSRGTSNVSFGLSGNRQPDESFLAVSSMRTVPAFIVEICNSQTLAQGDARAQAWLQCVLLGHQVQAVLVIKYWHRSDGGTFAAVAVLYEQGGGPGAARTVNVIPPVAPQVHVPGEAGGVAVDVLATPVAPTRVVSFGSEPPGELAAAMAHVCGLGAVPEGVGFPAAPGLCAGAPCNPGVPGYALRVPASRLYFGVPAGDLPAGFQADPLVADLVNDCLLELFHVFDAIEGALPPP